MRNLKRLASLVGICTFMMWVGVYGLASWDEALGSSAIVICLVGGLAWGLILSRFKDEPW
jgi:hypothetical protein